MKREHAAMASDALDPDRPIATRAEDKLGRAAFAAALARQIGSADASRGFVVGLIGPWGSGKTSLLNLLEESFSVAKSAVVLRFNPWLFSGTEQLVGLFFRELAQQLGEKDEPKLKSVSDKLKRYGGLVRPLSFLPFVGSVLSGAGTLAEALGKAVDPHAPSILEQRSELDKELQTLEQRLVVMIDDIDRLRTQEIRDLMALVKLTADFPNTVYVLAFDRRRVEEALSEDAQSGRAYLEKILQVAHDVPAIREVDLIQLLLNELQALLDQTETGPFVQEDWDNVFTLAMRPLFRNVRDVRRYLNSLPVTLEVIGDEVAVVDALALEAFRVLVPDFFAGLDDARQALTETTSGFGTQLPNEIEAARRESVTRLVKAAGDFDDAARQLIKRLFPAGSRYVGGMSYGPEWTLTWRKDRRVAHEDVLAFFLEKSLPPGRLPASKVEAAFRALGDESELASLFGALNGEEVEHLLDRLEDWQEEYPRESVAIALPIVMNQLPRLREGRRHINDFGADLAVTRVALRLLRRLEDRDEVARLVVETLPKIDSLSARLDLVKMVGQRENAGHDVVDGEQAAEIEALLEQDIKEASATDLSSERGLVGILAWIEERDASFKPDRVPALMDQDEFVLQLLRQSWTEGFSQNMDDVAVRSHPKLNWEWLKDLVGEALAKRRVLEIASTVDRGQLDDRGRHALELAEEHARG